MQYTHNSTTKTIFKYLSCTSFIFRILFSSMRAQWAMWNFALFLAYLFLLLLLFFIQFTCAGLSSLLSLSLTHSTPAALVIIERGRWSDEKYSYCYCFYFYIVVVMHYNPCVTWSSDTDTRMLFEMFCWNLCVEPNHTTYRQRAESINRTGAGGYADDVRISGEKMTIVTLCVSSIYGTIIAQWNIAYTHRFWFI